jgi:hypothetical protein
MPYEAARTAVLLGQACAAMADHVGAEVEFDTAIALFRELGAFPDLNRAERLLAGSGDGVVRGDVSTTLSTRELEVLAHLAAGRTNREIAERLVSARTPSRVTSSTSTPSSASPTGPRRPRTPSSTTWCELSRPPYFA